MTPEKEQDGIELKSGTQLLRGQYRIDRPLSHGGFGITYLVRDSLNRQVVVKECFPKDICTRTKDGVRPLSKDHETGFARILRQFKREAFRLAALEHPGIVRVHQVFEEKGTAFMAMDYVEGIDLFTVAEDQPERLDAGLLRQLLTDALDAVRYTHEQGILHRDISPDNLLLNADNHLTLIDFGSSYELGDQQARNHTKVLAVKDGYSPYEFYLNGQAQDVSSDLYALGATFHHLLTGHAPPDSQTRLAAVASGKPDPYRPLATDRGGHDRDLLMLIDLALAVHPQDRLRSARDWLRRLEAGSTSPEPADVAVANPDIADTISQLVSDTNSGLTPGIPKILQRREPHEDAEDTRNGQNTRKPATPVDIFGNPIEDVEKFLRDQDRLCRQGRQENPRGSSVTGKTHQGIDGNGREECRSVRGRPDVEKNALQQTNARLADPAELKD